MLFVPPALRRRIRSTCFTHASSLSRSVSEHKAQVGGQKGRCIAFAENGVRMAGQTDWNGVATDSSPS
ncbi:hypothetical protein NXS19_005365 [Fusarium pseudograminearum]|nr:hypothetical protein NXS19_005365 [Fusarium pseudograminearum]